MSSFMTRRSFEHLALVRSRLMENGLGSATPDRPGVAGLFVPWSGRRLAERGGI